MRQRLLWTAAVLVLAGCRTTGALEHGGDLLGEGLASFYGAELQGHATASGAPFDKDQLTAAHRTLAFGACVRVVNVKNGREVVVRVNDRGPFAGGRIIDLSEAAARQLDFLAAGVARVRLYACR